MNTLSYAACAGVVSLSMCAAVDAQVMLMEQASITETGQTFIFTFNGVPLSDGTDGTLLIEALGDYSPTPPSSETLSIDIDGVFSGIAFDPSQGATIGDDLFQNMAMQSYTVSGAELLTITGDGMVTMTLQNSSAVNFFSDQPEDFVKATLTYTAIPTPGVLALLGAAGLATRRRRRM